MQKSVVLGLSGGVDSAVAASLLLEQGFAVTGLYLDIGLGGTGAADAAAVADRLASPLRRPTSGPIWRPRYALPSPPPIRRGVPRCPAPCATLR